MAYSRTGYRSEPKWDNSRNVATFGRNLYPVSASKLKHLGTIYQNVPVSDGDGGMTFTPTKRSDQWMSIKMLTAEQIYNYRGKDVKAEYIIKMRYDVTIEESDSITIDGVNYEVIHIDVDNDRHIFRTAVCTILR